ncbi:MAG: glycosyltransferase family 1 protein [bacterium]|nr:glycosyltransferase family 1 protein [bacterium]
MKVVFDVRHSETAKGGRGIGVYVDELQTALKKQFQKDTFLLLEQGELPADADIIHYPSIDFFRLSLPLRFPKKSVVTVHDVIPLKYPAYYPPGLKGKVKAAIQLARLRRADALITDAHATVKDIINICAIDRSAMRSIPLAPRAIFSRRVVPKRPLGLTGRFFLYVGDVGWNKNIVRLGRAVKKTSFPMVFVGRAFRQNPSDHPELRDLKTFLELFRDDPQFIFAGHVRDVVLVQLYRRAIALVVPSRDEGFGLPVLEALTAGCPVIASDIPVLREIGGRVVRYVDQNDEDDIAEAMKQVVSLKTVDRSRLIRKGKEHAKQYTWEKTAEQTMCVYLSLLEKA